MIKVGVIGVGSIGKLHATTYQQVPGAKLLAIADIDVKTLEEVKNELGVPRAYTSYEDLLRDPDIQAVSVCLPNYLHHDVACAALDAGKSVLLEKPMAMNVAEAQDIVDCAKKKGKTLMIGFVHRFRPEVATLKSWIEEGRLGNIYQARSMIIRRRGVPGMGGWFTTKAKSGGGALIDIGVHFLDLAIWLMGYPEPVSVSGVTHSRIATRKPYIYVGMWSKPTPGGPFDVDDYAAALIRFKNGSALWMEASWALNGEEGDEVSVFGDVAGARVSLKDKLVAYGEFGGRIADITPRLKTQNHFEEELSHFVECVRDGKEPISTGHQGVVIQTIIDAIYESSKRGEEVRL